MFVQLHVYIYIHSESSKSHLLGDDDDSWGQGSDWSSGKKLAKTTDGTNDKNDWSAGNEDDLEAWLNSDTSALSGSKKSKSKKSNDEWDGWKGNNSSLKSSGKSSSSSKSKKKSQKSSSSSGVTASDGWDDADWNSGFTSTPSKQKEPLVGNLLDLDDGNGVSKHAAQDGWDNEVWAAEGDDDADDNDGWQTLELGGESNKTR